MVYHVLAFGGRQKACLKATARVLDATNDKNEALVQRNNIGNLLKIHRRHGKAK